MGAGTDIRVRAANLPIARYIYLVQDASDAARMGGTPQNTYTTFQNAYDAANTLQAALGGTERVAIMVGNTTAAAVGNLTLSANFNENVEIHGLSLLVSEVGNIVATNASGAGFSVGRSLITQQVRISNVKIGDISTSATGGAGTGNSGSVGIAGTNAWFGNINTSITNAANVTGNGGAVRFIFNTNESHLIIGTITTSSQATTSSAGIVSILSSTLLAGVITTANNNLSGAITIAPVSGAQVSSININSTGSSGNVSVKKTTTGAASSINFVSNSAAFTDCDIVDLTITDPSGSSTATFTRTNVEDYTSNSRVETNSLNCVFKTITSLGNNSTLSSTSVNTMGTAAPCINGIGTGCILKNTSLVGGTFSITNGSAVTVKSDRAVFDSTLNSNVTIELDGGVPTLSSAGTGNFVFDCSKYKTAKVLLEGDNAGANTISFEKAALGGEYILYVENQTGSDTLTISVAGGAGVVFAGSTPYTPTPSVGAYDKLRISSGFDGITNLFIEVFDNYG